MIHLFFFQIIQLITLMHELSAVCYSVDGPELDIVESL